MRREEMCQDWPTRASCSHPAPLPVCCPPFRVWGGIGHPERWIPNVKCGGQRGSAMETAGHRRLVQQSSLDRCPSGGWVRGVGVQTHPELGLAARPEPDAEPMRWATRAARRPWWCIDRRIAFSSDQAIKSFERGCLMAMCSKAPRPLSHKQCRRASRRLSLTFARRGISSLQMNPNSKRKLTP